MLSIHPSVCLSILKSGPLLGTLNFRNFKVFKNQLRDKPNLHIKGANLLKLTNIPKKLSGICKVLTLSWLLFLTV